MSLVRRPLKALADRLGEDRRETQGVTRIGDLAKKRGGSLLRAIVVNRRISGCGTPNFLQTTINAGLPVFMSEDQPMPMTKGNMHQSPPEANSREAGKSQGATTATRVIES